MNKKIKIKKTMTWRNDKDLEFCSMEQLYDLMGDIGEGVHVDYIFVYLKSNSIFSDEHDRYLARFSKKYIKVWFWYLLRYYEDELDCKGISDKRFKSYVKAMDTYYDKRIK